ncbi:carboxylesterase/lipase family protein [Rugamonas rubra]|uniref:Para-nitrobenzyl esterase n=1 Tax=Rugamonas rubra TaxID=758825 RepID=A0A1I4IFH2_9BURK|nr:carboxylesterase family protein [Rugamonas rubra]SFL53035.1 para-nitrobenzyl esterase [Rugamonas rubra]
MQISRVMTADGALVGRSDGRVQVYKGIPYAAPPVGELRWRPPQPVAAWSGERAALEFGPSAHQAGPEGIADLRTIGGAGAPFSEDCLTLNVWAPALGGGADAPAACRHGAPVMVWLHGGSGRMGAGSLPFYDGGAFAADGVVLVTLNYRLGQLGFFGHPALRRAAAPDEPLASFGIMDQIAALRWVRDNIAAFGGDPRRVTLFGESMGGFHVLALMACPSAQGLFQQAIVQSGGGWFPPNPLKKVEARGAALASTLGLPGAQATLEQLRALPAELVAAVPGEFQPVIDGRLLPQDLTPALAREAAAHIPLIIGANSGEDSLLNYPGGFERYLKGLKPALLAKAGACYGLAPEGSARLLFRDMLFVAPARWVARRRRRSPAYLYLFDQADAGGDSPRAGHGSEIGFVFQTLDSRPDGVAPRAPDRQLALDMHRRWVAFAHHGVPGEGWPRYRAGSDEWMLFQAPHGRISPVPRKGLDWHERRMRWIIALFTLKSRLTTTLATLARAVGGGRGRPR